MNTRDYKLPLSHEQIEARARMPLYRGYIVALDYVHERDVPHQEGLWRDFCRETSKHLWPAWLTGWADRKRARGLK